MNCYKWRIMKSYCEFMKIAGRKCQVVDSENPKRKLFSTGVSHVI